MKNFIKLIVSIIFISGIFTGCGQPMLPEQKYADVKVFKKDDGSVLFISFGAKSVKQDDGLQIILELKEAAEYGKYHGFKFFAVNGGERFNNLYGDPINSINSFIKFCSDFRMSEKQGGYCGEKSFKTKIYFFKENPGIFTVWDIDLILKEKIDISTYKFNEKEKEELTSYLNKYNIEYIN